MLKDQINFTLSLDNYTTDALKALSPHKSVFGLDEPREVSSNLAMPKPVVATIANWVHSYTTNDIDPVKAERMVKLLVTT